MASVEAICGAFAGPLKGKTTLKDLARAEIDREPSEVDKMLAASQVVAAVGRRMFDKEEIDDDDDEDIEEAAQAEADENLKVRVKMAKAKYLAMFQKPEEDEKKKKKEQEVKERTANHKELGLWDTVTSIKAIPTLMRVRREWMPPDWEKVMEELKAEGRDLASIDADLKEICQGEREVKRTTTGKYLMPEDLTWCRKHARFKEKETLRWFRKFRSSCRSDGTMSKKSFRELFKVAFPLADDEIMAEIVYELFDLKDKDQLDFKVCFYNITRPRISPFTLSVAFSTSRSSSWPWTR
jgi:hypothetical protein